MRKNKRFRKTDAYIGIVIIIILSILLFIFRGAFVNQSAINQEKVIQGNNITHINVSTNTGDVQISPYDGEEIRVQLTAKNDEKLSKRYKIKIKEKNNQLTIKVKKKRFAQDFIISVKLPNKKYEQITVEADVANITIGTVDAFYHYLKTSVGNITVQDANGIINAKAQVGNVELQFQEIISNIVAETEVGNITVKIEEAPTALQTVCKTSIGSTTINLPNVNDGSIGSGGPQVELTTEVGDVSMMLIGEN